MTKSKKKKRYMIERRIPAGTYSPEVEEVAPMLFEWARHPLSAFPDCYTTKKKAVSAISALTGSWPGWEFRPVLVSVKYTEGTWRGKSFTTIEVLED